LAGGAAGALLSTRDGLAGPPADKPNILLIHADQHRIECLGAYGNREIKTPHIDRLAAGGVRYDNSFCCYPVCTPSRYALLTGLYVHQHRGWTNHCTPAPGAEGLPAILKRAGYRAKAVGKMHFTPTYLDLGFEELELAEQNGPGRWDDDYHRYLRRLGLVDRNDLEDQLREYRKQARPEYWKTFGALVSNLPEEHHSTTWIAERAVKTLERWGPSGNLLMVGFIKPHHPFDPPKPWDEMYNPKGLSLLPGWTPQCFPHDLAMSRGYFPHARLTEPALRRVMAFYYATISQIDHHVGRMIQILKRKNLYDNTMIVYTADHGDYMGYHHLLLKGNYMYDPLAKVPLIIKYPGNPRKGTISQALVNNIDVAPTILRRAGCKPGKGMRGLDLFEDTAGHKLIFAHAARGRRAMARSRTRKLLLPHSRKAPLFFDLENDPLEMKNLHDKPAYQKQIQELKEAIASWQGPGKLPGTYLDERAPRIKQPNVPPLDDGHRREMMAYCRGAMKALSR